MVKYPGGGPLRAGAEPPCRPFLSTRIGVLIAFCHRRDAQEIAMTDTPESTNANPNADRIAKVMARAGVASRPRGRAHDP